MLLEKRDNDKCCLQPGYIQTLSVVLRSLNKLFALLVLHCCEKAVEIPCPNKILQKAVEFGSSLSGFSLIYFYNFGKI